MFVKNQEIILGEEDHNCTFVQKRNEPLPDLDIEGFCRGSTHFANDRPNKNALQKSRFLYAYPFLPRRQSLPFATQNQKEVFSSPPCYTIDYG